ncbi:MAG TPA: hypothetical protein VHW09_05240 [Bryobacteraceae bacterium]|jgi:hypothetical protein|nr:hypothetical protein [Bryobacteraceae bacterium]
MGIPESFARTWFLPIIACSAIAETLLFLGRLFRKARIPADKGQIPPGIFVRRDGDTLTVRYRWGDGWSIVMLVLFLLAVSLLALDAIAEEATYPIQVGAAVAFWVVVPAAAYGLLLYAFNSTVYTLTSTRITARKGPLPCFGRGLSVDLSDVERVVCLHIRAFSTYNLYAQPRSGRRRHIIQSGSSAEIAVALARLIPQVAPRIGVDTEI